MVRSPSWVCAVLYQGILLQKCEASDVARRTTIIVFDNCVYNPVLGSPRPYSSTSTGPPLRPLHCHARLFMAMAAFGKPFYGQRRCARADTDHHTLSSSESDSCLLFLPWKAPDQDSGSRDGGTNVQFSAASSSYRFRYELFPVEDEGSELVVRNRVDQV